ncbi:IclR family transcriptional regulator [Asticcacaulis taihuensis]|jgi:DNA-binding IclR family transcriptional regulator|uniref:IclR family transcriptional regulator n=1 Tax=Asticcacaulis taihuensis TaxID=260084 RepID=UPI0026E9F4BF|nr:helix-turn-helix domain-containing protein [Asticcacaulis taihuensis]
MRAKLNAQPNQSLIDGIATLQAVAISPEPVGCRELARQLGFEPSRVNRLLKTLAYLGIVRQTTNRKYIGGPGMHVLTAQSLYASGLIRHALPVLEGLQRFGMTVAMGVLWKDNVSFLYHSPPGMSATESLGRIGLYPASTSGLGLALMAEHDDDYIREIYENKPVPGFPDGIDGLLKAVELVRERGYARLRVKPDIEQHTLAVTVGRPVYAAIGLSGWIPEANAEPMADALKAAALQIGD